MAKSCSHWWHAPVYFTIALILAFIAVSTALRSNLHNSTSSSTSTTTKPNTHDDFALNASRALRRSGFNTIATLLQISPELFFSSSSESTIFAIKDSSISNITLPPLLMKQFLQYHTIPSKLSMEDLFKKPPKSCLQTLLHNKNVSITKINATKREIKINHVLISHPDLFLGGPISVHGVVRPFSPLKLQNLHHHAGLDFIQSPICDSNSSIVSVVGESKKKTEWTRIVRFLSSKRFVSFSIGLHSVLDGILHDYKNLSHVTIFAPPDLAFITSPSPLLDKIVRLHILSQRFTYKELASLPEKALLRTLVPDYNLEITASVSSKAKHRLVIDGVEITKPDIFTSKKFVVHGISRTFEITELPSTS